MLGKQIKTSSFCILKVFLFLKQFNWETTFNTVVLTQYQTLQSLSKIRCCTLYFQPLCSIWSCDETLWKKLIKDILLWKIQLLKRSIWQRSQLLTGNSAPLSAKAAWNLSKEGFFSPNIIINSAENNKIKHHLKKAVQQYE